MRRPLSKRSPAQTRATRWGAFTARHLCWADTTRLKTMARAAVREPAPRVTLVHSRTVEKADSMGFVVSRWIQCSARSRRTPAVAPGRR